MAQNTVARFYDPRCSVIGLRGYWYAKMILSILR